MKTKKQNKKISSFSPMYSSDEMIMVLNEQVRAYTEPESEQCFWDNV